LTSPNCNRINQCVNLLDFITSLFSSDFTNGDMVNNVNKVFLGLTFYGPQATDSQAATAEGLTFSYPIHKKSARNLNLYNFCHSPKKLAAVSTFSGMMSITGGR
jgi:hypothetical protein